MNCFEAQSKSIAFIENKLSDQEALEFVRHVKNCEDCSEELEIYYTMIVGMKHLDNDDNYTIDFKKELETKLNKTENRIKSAKHFRVSSVLLFAIAAITITGFAVGNFKKMIYEQEQNELLEAQGEYYFYNTFHDVILSNGAVIMREINDLNGDMIDDQMQPEVLAEHTDERTQYYESIRNYILEQKILDEDNKDEQDSIN